VFSLGTRASSTTKPGCHDIADILLKVVLKHQKSNHVLKKKIIMNFQLFFLLHLKICHHKLIIQQSFEINKYYSTNSDETRNTVMLFCVSSILIVIWMFNLVQIIVNIMARGINKASLGMMVVVFDVLVKMHSVDFTDVWQGNIGIDNLYHLSFFHFSFDLTEALSVSINKLILLLKIIC
jgi:ABC-type branched-subunit amino acid transport system permease subunit